MRRDGKLWLIALLLCIWPMAANADDSEAAKLVSECSAPDLPQGSLDSCLERVRVLEETDPSPRLQTLEAGLEQRESDHPARTRAAPAPAPRVVEVAPARNEAVEDDGDRSPSSQQAAQSESSAPRSGPTLEDEPPVSDGPDVPDGTDPADNETNDPPQA